MTHGNKPRLVAPMQPPILHPSRRAWWYLTIVAACFTGWLEPFKIAYIEDHCRRCAGALARRM